MAGYQGPDVFQSNVMADLFKYTQGIPRLVNVLCHKALMLAYGEGSHSVGKRQIKLAAIDTESIVKQNNKGLWLLLAGSLALSVAATIMFWQQWQGSLL